MPAIKSVMDTDAEIMKAISALYLDGDWFELDPCFSHGKFYKGLSLPKIRMDKTPMAEGVIQNDIRFGLPLADNSVSSVIFDPPFMFGVHGKTLENRMAKRFTMFNDFAELEYTYRSALREFERVLVRGGILAFKCQDYTDSRTTLTHCYVHNWAMECGLVPEDIFILNYTGGRIYNSSLKQKHARKYHCYWMVFRNKKGLTKKKI